MFQRHFALVVAVLTVVAGSSTSRAQSVKELLPLVPQDANSIAVVRVETLKESPRGLKEGWAKKHESEFLAGAVAIPPRIDLLVRASFVRPGTRGGEWTVFLAPAPGGDDRMSALAQREGTEVQDIDGNSVVWSPQHNGYFVLFTPAQEQTRRIIGGMAPATRQDAARWIENSKQATSSPRLSPYLLEAAGDESAQIMLALDMQDMLEPAMIRDRLNAAQALTGNSFAKTSLTLNFQSLRGLRLAVRVDDAVHATLRLDFNRQLGDEARYVKPLLIEFLNDAGAALDELEQAELQVDGRSVTLRMPLSDETLRRVLSLLTTPPPPTSPSLAASPTPSPPTPSPPTPQAETGIDVEASRRYFVAVNRLVDDLRRAYLKGTSYDRTAQWHENFARRIENMSTARVEPQLVAYGEFVRSSLRALAESLRGTAVTVNALDRSIVYNVETQPTFRSGAEWWWGGAWTAWGPYTYGQPQEVRVTSNLQDVRARQAEASAASAPQREQIWRMIDDERAAVRRTMIDRYGDKFAD